MMTGQNARSMQCPAIGKGEGVTTHSARLVARLSTEQKDLIEQAAGILGVSVSAFVTSTLVRQAQEVVESSMLIRLSNRDRDAFLAALDNPPEPNAKLRKAFRDHARQVR
jgi:uncharacterized protein (DUF1778 family)